MKSLLVLIAVVGLASGYSVASKGSHTTERTTENGRNRLTETKDLSPVNAADPGNGLVEVSEDEIPDDAMVYVLEEADLPQPDGESLKTADNIVFRPLFQYRNKQAALARRRNVNAYRRRYFVQRRPYRNVYYPYYYYYPYKWQ